MTPTIETAEMLVDDFILHHKQWMPERLVEAARAWPGDFEPGPQLVPPTEPSQEADA
jgi:hypothetical protein